MYVTCFSNEQSALIVPILNTQRHAALALMHLDWFRASHSTKPTAGLRVYKRFLSRSVCIICVTALNVFVERGLHQYSTGHVVVC